MRLLLVTAAALAGVSAGPARPEPMDAAVRPTARSAATVSTAPAPLPALPERAFSDTVGVLLPRHLDAHVAGVPVKDYLLWLPPGIEKGKGGWPLLVWLHGRSLRGGGLDRLKRYGPPLMLSRGKPLPFIVVSPHLPAGTRWADLDPVEAIVDDVVSRYPVDPDRVYLLGYSMGGGGAWRMAFSHADRYAAMIAIAGHVPPPTPENTAAVEGVPFLAIHGAEDHEVPLSWAERMAKALRADGAPKFEFRLVPGANHPMLERLTRRPELYAWLLEHRRGAAPAVVAVGG